MSGKQERGIEELLRPIDRVALIAVQAGVKPAIRITCDGRKTARLRPLVEKLGLTLAEGEVAIYPHSASGGITHTMTAKVSEEPRPEDHRCVYIGADMLAVRLAKTFEWTDARRFGLTLGYPSCCVDFFVEHYSPSHHDLVPDVAEPTGGAYQALINNACRHFHHAFISHFPCRWDCDASLDLAERTLRAVREREPELADATLTIVQADVAYSQSIVVAIRDARWRDSEVSLAESQHWVAGDADVASLTVVEGALWLRDGEGDAVAHGPFHWLPFRSQMPLPNTLPYGARVAGRASGSRGVSVSDRL